MASEHRLRRVCVFCGSSSGKDPIYAQIAAALGAELAARNITLVYGGGSIGLMGACSTAAVAAGGQVISVIPTPLAPKDLVGPSQGHVFTTSDMHERKQIMFHLSDAFIVLPGGLGTFEEGIESTTWSALGMHAKPTGLLNVAQYYDGLLEQIEQCASTVKAGLLCSCADPFLLTLTIYLSGTRLSLRSDIVRFHCALKSCPLLRAPAPVGAARSARRHGIDRCSIANGSHIATGAGLEQLRPVGRGASRSCRAGCAAACHMTRSALMIVYYFYRHSPLTIHALLRVARSPNPCEFRSTQRKPHVNGESWSVRIRQQWSGGGRAQWRRRRRRGSARARLLRWRGAHFAECRRRTI